MKSAMRNVSFLDPSKTTSEQTTPSLLAKKTLSEGLQALHPQLRDNEVIAGIAAKILQLFFTFKTKETSMKKFDDDTYLPKSCRFKGELKGSAKIRDTDAFKELSEKSHEDVLAFQNVMKNHMKNSANLELKALRMELMEKSTRFADLITKQKLFNNKNVCRVNDKSNELTIKVFKDEINDDDDEIIVDDDNTTTGDTDEPEEDELLEEATISYLRFKSTEEEMRVALSLSATESLNQGIAFSKTDLRIIEEVKAALKNTLSSAFNSYELQVRKLDSAKRIKEMILLEATTRTADDVAIELDKGLALPNNIEELKELFKAVILDHDAEKAKSKSKLERNKKLEREKKDKKNNKPQRANKQVKGDRGASPRKRTSNNTSSASVKKKNTSNNNNASTTTSTTNQRKKRKNLKQVVVEDAAAGSATVQKKRRKMK